jgi:hypothetical protein
MMNSTAIEIILSCGSWQQAQRIVDELLDKDLIAYAEFLPTLNSDSKHHHALKLIMISKSDYLSLIREVITEEISDKDLDLQSHAVRYVSDEAQNWLLQLTT